MEKKINTEINTVAVTYFRKKWVVSEEYNHIECV
jgi:hypothetical protein